MAGNLKFPENFLWGTATSPTQVEGHVVNEWTDYVAADGGHCRVACDHYHRYEEDVGWMSRLGVNAYRMGIEWSRLQTAPFAPLNRKELDRYVHLLDCLKSAHITPMVVLHHFSNPPWITSAGGWVNPATVPAFVDYAAKLVSALKERVHLWNTFNEPDTYASLTYLLGGFPPFRKLQLASYRKVIRHMAEAHIRASEAIRRGGHGGRTPEIGIAKNWTYFGAVKKFALWDHLLARISHHAFNRFVLAEFLGGRRRMSQAARADGYYMRRHVRASSGWFGRHPAGFSPALWLAAVHHRTRRGIERRRISRPRPDRPFASVARRAQRRHRRARIFLLVIAR